MSDFPRPDLLPVMTERHDAHGRPIGRDLNYSRPLAKKVIVRPPTQAEKADGLREQVIGEVVTFYDHPGHYYAANGEELDEATARRAGFNVDADKRRAERERRLAEAKAKIDKEYAELEAKAEAEGRADGQ
jgi:hypothetical protein